jgi:hypothetical protein
MSPLEKQEHQVGHDGTLLPTSPSSIVPHAGDVEIEQIILPSALVREDDLRNWSTLVPSAKSQRTRNPIREIVDPIVASLRAQGERNDGKECISLAVSATRSSTSGAVWTEALSCFLMIPFALLCPL